MEKLDERTESAVEIAQKDELFRNERTFDHPTFGTLRLQRPTPRQEREIAEARRRQYHKDMRDESILSKAELEKEAIRRGIWSKDNKLKLDSLQTRIGQIMGLLDSVGYESVDVVIRKYEQTVNKLRGLYEDENIAVQEAITRYFHLDGVGDPADHKLIFEEATTTDVDDAMAEAQLIRTQIELLTELKKSRDEMRPLLQDFVRLNMDSIESRMDRVEQLAKLYYCVTKDGKTVWTSFDAMWDCPPKDLEILLEELYYFEEGIPDEYRKILGRHGFTLRVPTETNSSESSQGIPQSNSSGESAPSEQTSSSVSTA